MSIKKAPEGAGNLVREPAHHVREAVRHVAPGDQSYGISGIVGGVDGDILRYYPYQRNVDALGDEAEVGHRVVVRIAPVHAVDGIVELGHAEDIQLLREIRDSLKKD